VTPEVSAEVLELAKRVELRELITTGTLARRRTGVASSLPGEAVDLSIGVRTGLVREAATFVALISLDVRARKAGAGPEFARFVHRFNVRYAGHGDASDSALQAFVNGNGMVHVWPYARAAVQAASASLGLVPIVLPIFRVQAPNGKPLTARKATG
jgi:hypothetical protein